jgi:hypothetical protein
MLFILRIIEARKCPSVGEMQRCFECQNGCRTVRDLPAIYTWNLTLLCRSEHTLCHLPHESILQSVPYKLEVCGFTKRIIGSGGGRQILHINSCNCQVSRGSQQIQHCPPSLSRRLPPSRILVNELCVAQRTSRAWIAGWPGINCISYEAIRRYKVGSDRFVMLDIAQLNLLNSHYGKSIWSLTQYYLNLTIDIS